MAAEFEEVIGNTNALQAKNVAPNRCEDFFCRRAWRSVRSSIFTARLFRCGQRFAINFAVWRKRHRIQQHEMCREHVFRQFVVEPEAEIWNQISKQSAAQRI